MKKKDRYEDMLTSNVKFLIFKLSIPTIISMLMVMFVLPQVLLIGSKLVDMTSFKMPTKNSNAKESGKVIVDGLVNGTINGTFKGIIKGTINGDVDLRIINGKAEKEDED